MIVADAMAQEYADKAVANTNFNPYQNHSLQADNTTTQGGKETAKREHRFRWDLPLSERPFITFPVSKKPNKHGIAIEISEEYYVETERALHIIYKIQGTSEEKGEFATYKGSVDFAKLREKFMKGWKGCSIPALPSASVLCKSEIDVRKNALEKFLKDIAGFPYLFYSADFQEFLKSEPSPSKEQEDFWMKQESLAIKEREAREKSANMNRMPILFQPSKSSEKIEQIPIPQNNQEKIRKIPLPQNNENKKNKHGIAIHIAGESRNKHEGFLYIDYKIKGSSTENGKFETMKGYIDFVVLREQFVIGWPGCAIPALPPASLFCNYHDNNDNARIDGLVKFLKAVADFPYLFYSAHFQGFLKSGPSSAKESAEFIKQAMKKSLIDSKISNKIRETSNHQNTIQKNQMNSSYSHHQIPQYNPPINYNYNQNPIQNYENNNNLYIKSVPPQYQNPSVTIVGDFQRANAFGVLHKEYHIRGSDEKGMFEVNRRYSDFVLIREILVEKWPGMQFQPLPPKLRDESVSEEVFQEARAKGLIAFLQSMTLMYGIFHTPEWQTFIKDPSPKIADKLKSFKKSTFSKIFGF